MTQSHKILVVDDEADIRTIVGLNLELAGHSWEPAADGAEALEMLRSDRWDGCILDLAMPRVDGLSVLRELGDSSLNGFAVVVLSARTTPQAALEALHAGAHGHIAKPFSPAVVVKVIEELMELGSEERATRRARMIERAEKLERLGVPTV